MPGEGHQSPEEKSVARETTAHEQQAGVFDGRQLLAEAAQLHFQPERVAAFREVVAACGLTEGLLRFADRCYALPMLASACRLAWGDPAGRPYGAEIAWRLDAAYYACAARRAALVALMERVADALTPRMPVLLLKGGALELLAPRAPAVRVTADLDLLVPHGEMARAEQLLQAAGLRPCYPAHVEVFRRHGHHAVPYEYAAQMGVVEVHETLAPRGAPVCLPVAAFWERSRPLSWRGRVLAVPSLEELVLHTCVHYVLLHPYNTVLRRLWDLGLLMTLPRWSPGTLPFPFEIDWEYVRDRARAWGAGKAVAQALAEVAGALGGRSSHTEPATCQACSWPLFDAPYSGVAAFRLQQGALETPWARLRALWHFLLPGPHETAPQRDGEAHWRYLLRRLTSLGARGATLEREGGS